MKGTTVGGPDGQRVVLLHSLALDRGIWDAHTTPISQFATAVACDLPGHGASCAVTTVSIESMADAVAEFLRQDGEQPVVAAGLSLGGCVAQALAARHPSLVAGLLLADTTAWYGARAPENWDQRARRAEQGGMAALRDFQLARWFTEPFLRRNPDVGEALMQVFTSNDVPSYAAVCRAMGAMDLRADLASIDVPTTVLVGAQDTATPIAHAEDLTARIRGARLRVLDGCAHLSALERPDAFVEEIRELVGRVA